MSNDENKVILKIFPAEIWLLILEHVKDAKQYHKFSSVSPFIRHLLLPRAPEILFPQVTKPILRQVQREVEKDYNILFVDHVCRYRQVCKAWREGVDNIIQTQHFNPNFPTEDDKFSKIVDSCQNYNFEAFLSSQDILEFKDYFESTHLDITSNPFVSRGVCFINENEEEEEPEEYYRASIRVLQKYGHHIWSCVIRLDEKFLGVDQISEFYQKLRSFLKLMPNLKTLEVRTEFSADLYIDVLDTMQANLTNNPFPTLPQLKHLTISAGNVVPVWALVQANQQLERVDAKTGCSQDVLQTLLKECKNVMGLALQPIISPELYSIFKADVAAPVENLWLYTSKAIPQAAPEDWKHIFFAIESRFSRNLKHLRLCLPKLLENYVEWHLKLPHLQILELEMEDLVQLDFLLLLKDTLEQLSLRVSATDPLEREQLSSLKVVEFWETLERSNAWELFPKLRLLRTAEGTGKWNICTRHQWRVAQAT